MAMPAVAIRRANAADVDTLRRLAALDSARPLAATSSSPKYGREPQAAIGTASGTAVADPIRLSGHVVRQLEHRAQQIAHTRTPRRRMRLVPRSAHYTGRPMTGHPDPPSTCATCSSATSGTSFACAMAGLRLADLLADGPMTVDEPSAAAEARLDLLRRRVRGLADIGLVTPDRDNRVSATEMGALLRSGTTGLMPESL